MIRFCIEQPGPNRRSRRAKELEKSARLSHAALTAYERKRREALPKGPDGPVVGTQITFYASDEGLRPTDEPFEEDELAMITSGEASYDNSVATILNNVQWDTFDGLAPQHLPPYVRELMADSLNHYWPKALPHSSTMDMRRSAAQLMVNCPVVLHGMMTVMPYTTPRPVDASMNRRIMHHRGQLIHLLREEIEASGDKPLSDVTILCIFCFVIMHGRIRTGPAYVSPYLESPLAVRQQRTQIRASVDWTKDNPHLDALSVAIAQKGGLSGIQDPMLAGWVSYTDLWLSSIDWTRPLIWRSGYIRNAQADFDNIGLPALECSFPLSSGFKKYLAPCKPLLKALQMAARLTTYLDKWHSRSQYDLTWDTLLKGRDVVQHILLDDNHNPWLLSATHAIESLDDPWTELPNLVHMAALIYQDLVLFPTLPEPQTRQRLSSRLQNALTFIDPDAIAFDREISLWLTVMGTLTASVTSRPWWIRRLKELLARRFDGALMTDFYDVRSELIRFSWWDFVCLPRALDIWDEMFGDSHN